MGLPSSALDNLPTRPPTPPKDLGRDIDDALAYLDDSFEVERVTGGACSTRPNLDTPPDQSPRSSAQADLASLTRGPKKVGFSPWTQIHELPKASSIVSRSSPVLRSLPPFKDDRPLKSILKRIDSPLVLTPNDIEPTLDYFSPKSPKKLAKMLESIVQMLAGQSRSSRLDAYLTLNGALKAYDGMPTTDSLQTKMALFEGFILRDMDATMDTTNAPDTPMVMQALKLAAAFLYAEPLSTSFTDEFRRDLVDRSITALEDPIRPKAIVNHHMYLLAQQKFSKTTMTPARVEKMLTALHTIEQRVSGNSVIAARLVVYQRLVEQAPHTMTARVEDWLSHVFHGMLSSIKDVRMRAIETATQAGLALGTDLKATKAVVDFFSAGCSENDTYGQYFIVRLMQMISDKKLNPELGPCTAQILAAVILFFRNPKRRVEQWPQFKDLLQVMQKCLNMSDLQVKYQANVAWNRLVFATELSGSTSKSMINMFKAPISNGLQKKGADKHTKQVRQIALATYCNLLYYAMRPNASHEELDLFWAEYVEDLLRPLIQSGSRDCALACRVMSSLLGNVSIHIWNKNQANEQESLKPEDLPRVDPRWTRLRIKRILSFIEPCLNAKMWQSKDLQLTSSPMGKLWRALSMALSDAGAQEVKVSLETKQATAHTLNLLTHIWSQPKTLGDTQADDDYSAWFDRFRFLTEMLIVNLGPLNFTEKILARTEEEVFEAAPTPSHRSSKHHGTLYAPISHLFRLFLAPPDTGSAPAFLQMARTLLKLCCDAKPSRNGKLELLALIDHAIDLQNAENTADAVRAQLWQVLAEFVRTLFCDVAQNVTGQDSQQLGLDYSKAVKPLLAGMRYMNASVRATACGLLDALVESIKKDAGKGGLVLAVVEPVAQLTAQTEPQIPLDGALVFASKLLLVVPIPANHQAMERGRKALWGSALPCPKLQTYDPFDHVYRMIVSVSLRAYTAYGDTSSGDVPTFLRALALFLPRTPVSLLRTILRKVQTGLVPWIRDEEQRWASTEVDNPDLAPSIVHLWKVVVALIRECPRHDSLLLEDLGDLVTAGLSSSRRNIVNTTIELWNDTFGKEEKLDYPKNLEKVLRKLRHVTELSLPTFPESPDDEMPATLPSYVESQDDIDVTESTSAREIGHVLLAKFNSTRLPSGVKVRDAVRLTVPQSTFPSDLSCSTPGSRTKTSSLHSTPKARLRHDDSQIQFAAIESSPLEAESQYLTDHQKDVNSRQHFETAQMFPDIRSSSPIQPSASKAPIPRLDLGTPGDPKEHAGLTTPVIEAQDPTLDYLSWSPTPRALTKHVLSLQNRESESPLEDVRDVENQAAPANIPSSPPEETDEFETARDTAPDAHPHHSTPGALIHDAEPIVEMAEESCDVDKESCEITGRTERLEPAVAPTVHDEAQVVDVTNPGRSIDNLTVAIPPTEPQLPGGQPTEELERVLLQKDDTKDSPSDHLSPSRFTHGEQEDLQVPSSQVLVGDVSVNTPHGLQQSAEGVVHPAPSDETTCVSCDDSTTEFPTAADDGLQDNTESQQKTTSGWSEQNHSAVERIDDSFPSPVRTGASASRAPVEDGLDDARSPASTLDSWVSQQPTKKRKADADIKYAGSHTKRRKTPKSPFKRFISRIIGQPSSSVDENEEEDIGDCIELAPRPSQMPLQKTVPSLSSSGKLDISPTPTSTSQSSETAKRKRGSQRKSEMPVSGSASRAAPVRNLRRSASALSEVADDDDTTIDISAQSKVTPSPSKIGRKTHAEDVKTAQARYEIQVQQSALRLSSTPGSIRRTLAAVVIPASRSRITDSFNSQASHVKPSSTVEDEQTPTKTGFQTEAARAEPQHNDLGSSPQRQLHEEEAAATPGRVIARPKSILERLKGILVDCKNMVLGSQEERELDDVLFQVRREVHEAGRRARED
ncbi:hypothetical protein LTR50_003661 [Elasticomyces elasticus]|nr:hypothetical protein LTR50_003661 [Elasticomyces elasticus]